MLLNCQGAAELASEADHRTLSRSERFWLTLHFRLCRCAICKKFAEQMKELRRAYRSLSIRQARGEVALDSNVRLSDEARERIRTMLDRK